MSGRRIPSHTQDATSVALSDVPFKDTSSYFPSVYLQHLGLFYLLQPITFLIPLPTWSHQIERTNAVPCLSACGRLCASGRERETGGGLELHCSTDFTKRAKPPPSETAGLAPTDTRTAVPALTAGPRIRVGGKTGRGWFPSTPARTSEMRRGGTQAAQLRSPSRQPGHVDREPRCHPPCSARRAHFPRRPPVLGEERRRGRKGEEGGVAGEGRETRRYLCSERGTNPLWRTQRSRAGKALHI